MAQAEFHIPAGHCCVLLQNGNISLFWWNAESETSAVLLAGASPPGTGCLSCFAGPGPSSVAFQQQVLLFASLKPSSSSSLGFYFP